MALKASDIVHRWHLGLKREYKTNLLIAGLFFAVAAILTWPFIVNPLSTQVGANYGDIVGSISKFEAIKTEGNNPFTDGHLKSFAYPDRVNSNVGVDRVSFFSTLFLWPLTILVNATFAHSLMIFLGYMLSGTVLALFINRFTKKPWLGVIGGLIFITFPLFVSLARAAPIYMWSWLYILPLWAMLELALRFSKKKLLLACLSIIPGIFWTPYFLLHILLIAFAALIPYTYLHFKKQGKWPIKTVAILTGAVVVVLGSYYISGMSSQHASIPVRTVDEAYEQSLHPLMLLFPTERSALTFPIYESAIKPIRPRGADLNLYIGISIFLLALFATYLVLKRSSPLPKEVRIMGLFALSISIITFSFSLAPTVNILGLDVPTPNYLVVHLVPALRAGQRLVVPLMLGVTLLAVIAFYYISTKKWKRVRPQLIIASLLVLIACEYTTIFDGLSAPVHSSEAVKTLAYTPKGIVAEYLNDSLIGYPGQRACKNFFIHRQQMVNSCSLDIYTEPGKWPVIEAIAKKSIDDQLAHLRSIGVKYIIADVPSVNARQSLASSKSNATLLAQDDLYIIYGLK